MVPLTLTNWELVAEACLEEGWSEGDIAYLKDLVAFVNTFKVISLLAMILRIEFQTLAGAGCQQSRCEGLEARACKGEKVGRV